MVSDSGRKRLPPYVSYRTFRNFIDQLGPRVPARIDRSYWGAMLSGSSGGHLMAALRFLDLIDDREQPTDRLKSLASAKGNHDHRVSVLHSIATDSYAFVFQGSEDPQNSTYAQMEEKFLARYPLKPDVSRKCLKFFFELSHDAGIPQSPFITKRFRSGHASTGTKTVAKRTTTRAVTKTTTARTNRDTAVPRDTDEVPELSSWDRMLLTKFPTFDPAWSDEVKMKWFSAFDELMKRILARSNK
ncbi:MAG: hypothetical protein A2147_03780 [Chloroflexi bacterium RBG_16_57_8]|nr:MAG: hypothetical protein A2147_03780 [Chloroflexi bacterium RBG_16_57_8]